MGRNIKKKQVWGQKDVKILKKQRQDMNFNHSFILSSDTLHIRM